MQYPWGLDFWKSGEWQAANERIHDLEKEHGPDILNPVRSKLFASLTSVGGVSKTRVAIVGQDPYPYHGHATGLAFSIPREYKEFPPTLRELYAEYKRDLGLPTPSHGDLTGWGNQGVLLWNVIPCTLNGRSLACDWPEWEYLNKELFERLSTKGIVFAFLGGVARRYASLIPQTNNRVILTSHPSPRGSLSSRLPFKGSRLFTAINNNLEDIGLERVNWRIDETPRAKVVQRPAVAGGRILPNLTGANLGGLKGHSKPSYARSTFELDDTPF